MDFNSIRNIVLVLSLFFSTLILHGQTVSTLVSEFPGDGEISFDSEGNIYVNDSGENGILNGDKVYKVTPSGEFSLFQDNLPIWVVGSMFDLNGNLLVTGWQAGTISRIAPDGNSSQVIVRGINGAGSLEVDEAGNIYVAEYLMHRVLKYDSDGNNLTVYASGNPIRNPAGLAYVESTGNLYVSNWTNNKICVIDSNQNATVFAEIEEQSVGPIKIFGNYMYATSPQYHKIYKINMSNPAEVILFAGTGQLGNKDGDISIATFNTPTGIGTINGDTFYVAETYQNTGRLRIITGLTNEISDQDRSGTPRGYHLEQNFPNPFNPSTTIKYRINKLSFVTLKVYDVLGNEVATLVREEKPAGNYEVEFSANGGLQLADQHGYSNGNAYSLPSGIYFYELRAGDYYETKKMVLQK